MTNLFKEHWSQLFFSLVGLVFLGASFYSLYERDIAGASVTFGMAFLCFIYSNVSRFKRFKGLGFEAELWEDKQKEAAQLIDRLKAVVSIYTREVVTQRVLRGRFAGRGTPWKEDWELYEDLVAKHDELGQAIDFSDLKSKLDKIFLFDIVSLLARPVLSEVSRARGQARELVDKEFGSSIVDIEGYNARVKALHEVPAGLDDLFERSQEGDVAAYVLDWIAEVESKLSEHFEITIDLPADVKSKLKMLSKLCNAGPIPITDELIAMTYRD